MIFARAIPSLGVIALALAPLLLTADVAAGGGGCHQPNQRQESGGEVRIDESGCFAPLVLRTEPGTRVYFRNDGQAPHNVVGQGWSSWASFSDGIVAPGERFSYTFREPGYYPFACSLHPGMVGLIIAGDPDSAGIMAVQPAAAKTGGDGLGTRGLALLAAAGVLAIGMIGGGALARFRRQ
jgi:plastocyanin